MRRPIVVSLEGPRRKKSIGEPARRASHPIRGRLETPRRRPHTLLRRHTSRTTKLETVMTRKNFRAALAVGLLIIACSFTVAAQSGATRPRRVLPNSEPPQPTPTPTQSTRTSTTAPSTSGDTTHAYTLLQQNQNEAAARETKQIAAVDPNNAEAWKIAGFAEFNLKQYKDAALDLQNALNLQRKSGAEDANTLNALAEALARSEQFDRALPLLVTATTRAGAQPDPTLLYLRGLAEFNTGKRADAERSFNAAVKADPKNTAALFYLGRIAYEQKNLDNAIAM